MAPTLKPLDENTLDSVREVVTDRFSPDAYRLLRQLLANPWRQPGDDIGAVVSDGESVAGATASIVRRLYYGQEPLVGICGGVLAMRRDASPALLFPLLRRSHRPRFGSVLLYSNTCSPATARLKPCVGVRNAGPDTWNQVRYVRLRRLPLLCRRCSPLTAAAERRGFAADRSLGLVVRARADFAWADGFFARYLSGNAGLVGSRTAVELQWAFGEELASGRLLVLAAEGANGIAGYAVVAPCSYDAGRWMVLDAIALNNDRRTLGLLFRAAREAVRRCSAARVLSVLGFPAAVADLIAAVFPQRCATAGNGFWWGFSDPEWDERCTAAVRDGQGWFFGPYDGDYCLSRV